MDENIIKLHASLTSREQPEWVASTILRAVPDLTPAERKVIGKAARWAERNPWYGSMMPNGWEQPPSPAPTAAYVQRAFTGISDTAPSDPEDLEAVGAWRDQLVDIIGWTPGVAGALNRADLHQRDLSISMRRWRRAWHALDVLDGKLRTVRRMQLRARFARSARSGLAATITLQEVQDDPGAAAFCAYIAAKRNLRRGFDVRGRPNSYDEVADVLFKRLGDSTDWWMVARVHPTAETVERLDQTQRGQLISAYWDDMRAAAELCAQINQDHPINRSSMIVDRGDDSDTWNLAAGAFNTARLRWLTVLEVTGQQALCQVLLPPKLMRLMAADLIYWHSLVGNNSTHPDVRVAADLPAAWDVMAGRAECTISDIVAACERHGVDPAAGWTGPIKPGQLGQFEPTPELVHGIAVGDPILASMLRRAHAFSGKPLRLEHLPEADFDWPQRSL